MSRHDVSDTAHNVAFMLIVFFFVAITLMWTF